MTALAIYYVIGLPIVVAEAIRQGGLRERDKARESSRAEQVALLLLAAWLWPGAIVLWLRAIRDRMNRI